MLERPTVTMMTEMIGSPINCRSTDALDREPQQQRNDEGQEKRRPNGAPSWLRKVRHTNAPAS